MSTLDEDPNRTQVLPRVDAPGGGQPPYGTPATGAGMGGPPKRKLTWLWVLLGILGGLMLGVAVVWAVFRPAGAPVPVTPAATTTTPVATATVAATVAPPPVTKTEPAPKTPPEPPAPDTTPPKTPTITFPPANYWLAPENMKVMITWKGVSDPSGASYRLEFSDRIGGGAGWDPIQRVNAGKQRYWERVVTGFKERWRIIAIDGAGNESDPSAWQFLIPAASASEAASLNAQ
jgi:hypothetical protein